MKPILIDKHGSTEIWSVGGDFYVYAGVKLVRVCPSVGMAREVAAGTFPS